MTPEAFSVIAACSIMGFAGREETGANYYSFMLSKVAPGSFVRG
jgi:hypothetical protein